MMQIKVFTLKFSRALQGFDDEAVSTFVSDKEVVSINEHFFIKDNVPFLVLVVRYNVDIGPDILTRKKAAQGGREEYLSLLNDETMPLYEKLREWRNENAKKKGQPPYIILKNVHLARIAAQAPDTLNRLGEIDGIGKVTVEKYGREILAMVKSFSKPDNIEPGKEIPNEEKKGRTKGRADEKKTSFGPQKETCESGKRGAAIF